MSESLTRWRPMSLLDPPADSRRWGVWETGALLLYVAVVCFGIAQHVPWADESQAWMLAQDVSLRTLLVHSLHYEGTPGLWHCLLKLLQAMHLSFTAARWISGCIAGAGVAVLLGYAPFPRILQLLLPFSFFLAYQDAVIARSYVLFAVFAFTAAAMLRGRRPRPLTLGLVLGLMANISLHALLASGTLALVAAARWRDVRGEDRFRYLGALALLIVFWAGAAATMFPSADIDFSAGNNVQRSAAKIEKQLGFQVAAPPPLQEQSMAGLPRVPVPVHVRHGFGRAWYKAAHFFSVVTYPLATSRALALLLAGLVLVQACVGRGRQKTPGGASGSIGLAPWLLMVVIFSSLYLAPRHVGMVFTGFLVTAWLTWPERLELEGRRLALERVTAVVFSVVVLMQIGWTVHALRSEQALPYSPDRMTAEYLKAHASREEVAGYYYYSVGPLPGFDRNIYINQPPHRYWLWSTRMRSYSTVEQVLARRPALIVIGGLEQGPEYEITRDWEPSAPPEPGVTRGDSFRIESYFLAHGYREARVFCGHSWMRASYSEQVCLTVLERESLQSRQ